MCELCLYTPCLRGCPNYDEDSVGFIVCPSCNTHLYERDIYYPDFDICEFCIDEYKKEVEIDQREED